MQRQPVTDTAFVANTRGFNNSNRCLLRCRYVQLNVRFTDAFRTYDPSLPAFLRHRPSDFVTHVRQRWTAAEVFIDDDIIITGDRAYAVHSPDTGRAYEVNFGRDDDGMMPVCSCEDWRCHRWPCVHFCACFRRTAHGWDDLASSYRDSPYLAVDTDVVQLLPADTSTLPETLGTDSGGDYIDGACEEVATGGSLACMEVSTGGSPGSAEDPAVQCREVLRQLVDATYLCSDGEQLSQLHTVLVSALATFALGL